MAEDVENLLPEHIKRFQATFERIERELRELKARQNETHSAVFGLRRDQAQGAAVTANLQVELDGSKTASTASNADLN